jgi:hypothetical protein
LFPPFLNEESAFSNQMTKKRCFSKPRQEQKLRGQERPFPSIPAVRTSTQALSQSEVRRFNSKLLIIQALFLIDF